MSFHLKLLSAVGIAAGLVALPVSAQYVGPNSSPQLTQVAEILKNPKDDADVIVRGQLLRQVRDEKYMFSDGSGEILVEIDDDDFPRQPVDETTTVELIGEVDTGRRRAPEIDVDTVRIVK